MSTLLLGIPWPLLAVAAFASMYLQDVLGVILVRAESSGHAHRAASMDTAQDVCWLASFWAMGDSLFAGHPLPVVAAIIAARLAADYSGTYSGVRLGQWIDRNRRVTVAVPVSGGRREFFEWLKSEVRKRGSRS